MAWVWLNSGFLIHLRMRLHSKRLPSGSNIIRYEFTDLKKLAGKVQSNMNVTNRDL